MERFMAKFLKSSLISSITLLIISLFLFFETEATIITISYIIGSILIAIGTITIMKYINNLKSSIRNELDIIYGVGMAILGIIVISNPKGLASIIPFVLGIIMIITSATKLQISLDIMKKNEGKMTTSTILLLITCICGVVLIFNPFSGAKILAKIIGIIILIYAILDIVSTFKIQKIIKKRNIKGNDIVTEATVIEDKTKKIEDIKRKKGKKKEND